MPMAIFLMTSFWQFLTFKWQISGWSATDHTNVSKQELSAKKHFFFICMAGNTLHCNITKEIWMELNETLSIYIEHRRNKQDVYADDWSLG